ncbi:unnamed protein product, partial [Prunus brigantina]
FLKQELSSNLIQAHRLNKHIGQEVDHALKCPYHANLGRLSIRKVIKHYNADSTRILKSSYRVAVHINCTSQFIHRFSHCQRIR